MDPTLEENQRDQNQKQQSGGGINQGINAINKLASGGLKNPFGKIGSRVAIQTALRGFAALLAGPGLPIAITIILILVFTFIIVGFGGAPSSGTSSQTTSPTLAPTIIVPSPTLSPEPSITTPAEP